MEKKAIIPSYFEKLISKSNNYWERFIIFLFIAQLLIFCAFSIGAILIAFGINPLFSLIIFGVIMFAIMLILLFINIRAKSLSFFSSGIIYLFLSLMFYFSVLYDSSSVTSLNDSWGFPYILTVWNICLGTLVLSIGIVRLFILGLMADYKSKNEIQKGSSIATNNG